MHEAHGAAGMAEQAKWWVSHCRRHQWAASPVLGTEVCRSCGKSPSPPTSSCAPGFLIFFLFLSLAAESWVPEVFSDPRGNVIVRAYQFKCSASWPPQSFVSFTASPLPIFFLSFIIMVREGKEKKHFRNERLVCCIIKMSFVITFL